MSFIKHILILILGSIGFSSCAQNIHSEKIDSYIKNVESRNLDVGRLSIFKDGKEVYSKSFGKVEGQVYNQNSTSQIGSVTKLFTAILTWKLIENKKLKLDTKLSEFYPEIENAHLITIKNLLEHTSGLRNYIKKEGNGAWLGEARTETEILDEIKAQKSLFKPNDSVFYSNSGYYFLARIIEKKFKDNYGNIVRKEITKPLHLKYTNSTDVNPKNVSKSLKFVDHHWEEKGDFYFKNILGVGDISSNPADLNILINQLFKNKILKKESLVQMKPIIGKEIYGRGTMNFDFNTIHFYGNTGAFRQRR